MSLRVLHILWSGRIGGKERAVFQLVRSQIENSKFEPAIAFGQANGFYVDEMKGLGCEVVDLKMRAGRDFSSALWARARLRRFPIHHFHSAEIPIMASSLLCNGVQRCYTHRAGIHQASLTKRLGYKLVGQMLKRGFRGLSANTRHATVSAAEATAIPQHRWAVTYNGMDFELLNPKINFQDAIRQFGVDKTNKIILGTTAHLRKWKRIELLIEACASLAPESYQLLIVGDGPDRQRLEQVAQSFKNFPQIKFIGMQEQIGNVLQVMDVFVLPSGPGESFGNSAIEALGVGLPTLVFNDGGGLVEHVKNGETGFIVNSVDELSTRLKELISDEFLRQRLGKRARELTREKYSLRNMIRTYDQFYSKVLEDSEFESQ